MATIVRDEHGRIVEIQEEGETVWNKEEERKETAKKTIKALEGTNGRDSNASQQAQDRLDELFG